MPRTPEQDDLKIKYKTRVNLNVLTDIILKQIMLTGYLRFTYYTNLHKSQIEKAS